MKKKEELPTEGIKAGGSITYLPEPKKQEMGFGNMSPEAVIEKASEIANKLVPIVEKAKLYTLIRQNKYVHAEGWATMLAMLGIFPATEYSRKLERTGEIAYEARVNLVHVSGAQMGSGEAICSSKERSKATWEEYAIKSMAQTRAMGKAGRLGFSWIMKLAGYEPTPAEEMVSEAINVEKAPENRSSVEIEPIQEAHSDENRALITPLAVESRMSAITGKPYWIIRDEEGVDFYTTEEINRNLVDTQIKNKGKVLLEFDMKKWNGKVIPYVTKCTMGAV